VVVGVVVGEVIVGEGVSVGSNNSPELQAETYRQIIVANNNIIPALLFMLLPLLPKYIM
jgi:hypothetical protein